MPLTLTLTLTLSLTLTLTSYVPDGPVNSWVLLQREGETPDDVAGQAGLPEGHMDVDEVRPAGAGPGGPGEGPGSEPEDVD